MSDLTTARISDLSHDARGVAEIDGRTMFVAGALPGESVRVDIDTTITVA